MRDGRILGVGTRIAIQAHRGPDTRMLDVGDAAVYPGFVDVHNHHAMAGRTELFELSLPPSLALDDILDLVRDRAQTLPPDAWIVSRAWSRTHRAEAIGMR